MMPDFKITVLGFLLAVLVAAPGGAAPGGPLVAVELETHENTLDSCMDCGCRAKGELGAGARREWWIAFGLVRSDDLNGWTAADSSSRCGAGSFDKKGRPVYEGSEQKRRLSFADAGGITLPVLIPDESAARGASRPRPRWERA